MSKEWDTTATAKLKPEELDLLTKLRDGVVRTSSGALHAMPLVSCARTSTSSTPTRSSGRRVPLALRNQKLDRWVLQSWVSLDFLDLELGIALDFSRFAGIPCKQRHFQK